MGHSAVSWTVLRVGALSGGSGAGGAEGSLSAHPTEKRSRGPLAAMGRVGEEGPSPAVAA